MLQRRHISRHHHSSPSPSPRDHILVAVIVRHRASPSPSPRDHTLAAATVAARERRVRVRVRLRRLHRLRRRRRRLRRRLPSPSPSVASAVAIIVWRLSAPRRQDDRNAETPVLNRLESEPRLAAMSSYRRRRQSELRDATMMESRETSVPPTARRRLRSTAAEAAARGPRRHDDATYDI